MKSSNFHDPEGNQDIFDVATIIVAGALGGLGAVATGSPEIGAVATGVIAATGIGVARVKSVQDKMNKAAMALTKSDETNYAKVKK